MTTQTRSQVIVLSGFLSAALAVTGCQGNGSPAKTRIHPVYDQETGKLKQLEYDSDGDGVFCPRN